MIRSDAELHDVRGRLRAEERKLAEYRDELDRLGLPDSDIAKALAPVHRFAEQLRQELADHERVRRGELSPIEGLEGLGALLVAARVASGLSQREFAARLGVHESLVSRDEKHAYHGVAIERAAKVFETLGVRVRCTFEFEPRHEEPR